MTNVILLISEKNFKKVNILHLCPYPTNGNECQKLCNCSKDMRDASTGCQSFTTGYNVFYSTTKAKAQPLQVVQLTYSHQPSLLELFLV